MWEPTLELLLELIRHAVDHGIDDVGFTGTELEQGTREGVKPVNRWRC